MAGFLAGGVLILLALRRARPGITPAQTALVAAGIALALALGAVGAIDAGNP